MWVGKREQPGSSLYPLTEGSPWQCEKVPSTFRNRRKPFIPVRYTMNDKCSDNKKWAWSLIITHRDVTCWFVDLVGELGTGRPVNLSGHPPFFCLKNTKLECQRENLVHSYISTLNGSTDATAKLSLAALPIVQQLHPNWAGGATDMCRSAS